MAAGHEARDVVLGGVDGALGERGVEFAPGDRGRGSAERLHGLHGDGALLRTDLQALHVLDRPHGLLGGIKAACAGIEVADAHQAVDLPQEGLADLAVHDRPEVVGIAEEEGRADDLELGHGAVEHGRRALRELDLGVLRLLETFILGADHAARVDLQHHRAGGELAEAFGHVDHRLMDRVVGGEPVPQTEDLDAARGPGGTDCERRDGGGDETRRQDVEDPPGQGIRERLTGLLGL